MLGVLQEFSISRMNVAAVTTDAAMGQHAAIDRDVANHNTIAMSWLPCIFYMMNRVMKVMMAEIAEVWQAVEKRPSRVGLPMCWCTHDLPLSNPKPSPTRIRGVVVQNLSSI